MKKAVILHGTGGKPESNWFPWLKKELENKGYEVWVPFLPGNETPNRQVYNDFLLGEGWDFTDNLVIGHSSGSVSVLNLLEDPRCPKIYTGVIVGSWYDTKNSPLTETDRFAKLFPPEGFNFELIKQKTNNLLFFHGDNDNHCPLEQAQYLAKQLDSEIIIIPNGGHLFAASGFTEFPQLLNTLEERKFL